MNEQKTSLNATQTHIKIPLATLRVTTNVRTDFDETEIAELAQSIKENGLINAITVRPPVTDENGDKTYEVIAGGRRIRAHQWLCDHGDDFSMIDCKISTGDTWTIQMIENIQRTDLTPREKENAIARALDQGMSQKEIAERLSKPQAYISDIVAGMKVRKIADAAHLNTDAVSSKALSQLRGIPESDLPRKLEELCMRGGSVALATALLHEWKAGQAEKKLAKETPHGDFTMPTPTTPESNEEAEISEEDRTDEVRCCDYAFAESYGRKPPEQFADEADSIEYDEDDTVDEGMDAPRETREMEAVAFVRRAKINTNRFRPGAVINAWSNRLFFSDLQIGMQFVHASDEKSHMFLRVCEVTKINTDTEQAFYTDGDRSCGHGIINKKDIDSKTNKHDDWIFAIPVEAREENAESAPNPKKKPDGFNWCIKDATRMESAMLALPAIVKGMPRDTKICIQAGSKVAEISSVIYEPNENRLIFRSLDDFGIH